MKKQKLTIDKFRISKLNGAHLVYGGSIGENTAQENKATTPTIITSSIGEGGGGYTAD